MQKVTGLALLLILGLLVSLNTGCGSLERVTEAHAQADRANLDAVAPEYLDMSKNAYRKKSDGTFEKWFTDEQAARRDRTVQAWTRHVESAEEEALGTKKAEPDAEPEATPEPEEEPTEPEDDLTPEDPAPEDDSDASNGG